MKISVTWRSPKVKHLEETIHRTNELLSCFAGRSNFVWVCPGWIAASDGRQKQSCVTLPRATGSTSFCSMVCRQLKQLIKLIKNIEWGSLCENKNRNQSFIVYLGTFYKLFWLKGIPNFWLNSFYGSKRFTCIIIEKMKQQDCISEEPLFSHHFALFWLAFSVTLVLYLVRWVALSVIAHLFHLFVILFYFKS